MDFVLVVIGIAIALAVLSLVSDTAGDILDIGCMVIAAAFGIGMLILIAKLVNAFG
jgi:hypothetical protein